METLIGVVGKDFVMTATDMSALQSIVVFKTDEDKTRHLTDHIVLAFAGEAGDTVQVRGDARRAGRGSGARLPGRAGTGQPGGRSARTHTHTHTHVHTQFAEYIEKNIKLYTLRNGIELNPEAAANYTRNELAQALRSRVRGPSRKRLRAACSRRSDRCTDAPLHRCTDAPMHRCTDFSVGRRRAPELVRGQRPPGRIRPIGRATALLDGLPGLARQGMAPPRQRGQDRAAWLTGCACPSRLRCPPSGRPPQVPYAAHGYGSFFVLSTLDRHYERDLSEEEALELIRKCIHEIHTRFLVNQPNFRVKVVNKDGIRIVSL